MFAQTIDAICHFPPDRVRREITLYLSYHVLSKNTNCVCARVFVYVCESGPSGGLCCLYLSGASLRTDHTEAKTNQPTDSFLSLHPTDDSPSFTCPVLYFIHLFCSLLSWLFFQRLAETELVN